MVTRLMESSRSSRLTIYDESGASIECPVEGRKYGIAIDIVKERWAALSLKLGTVPLSLRMDEEALFAHSELPPCAPGHYDLSLVCGVFRERRTITVKPQHFTDGDIKSMMYDLTERLPKSIATLLQNCGGLSGIKLAQDKESTIEQEFLKLSLAMNGTSKKLGILQILPMLQRECHQVMVSKTELRYANQVRRPDISKLPMAMVMADNIAANGALKQMFEATVEQSFETYENRLVKAYVQNLQGQLSRLQARLKSEPAPPAIANDLEALSSEFRLACTRATFLRKVRIPLASAPRITMLLLKNPAYRAVLEDYVALHKQSTIRLAEPALSAPLNKFPYLYQLWSNLTVVSVMLKFCAAAGYQCLSHHLIKRDNEGLFIQFVNAGEAAIELSCPATGRIVSLVSWRPDTGSRNSPGINLELPPLTVISIYSPDKPPVTLLFAPKYKVVGEEAKQAFVEQAVAGKKTNAKRATAKKEAHQNAADQKQTLETFNVIELVQEDIDELSQCMDNIRGLKVVRQAQYGAILYPGQRRQIASNIEALPALPSDREALVEIIYDVLRRYLA
jgi:Domain of unknown function (DUF2357)/PD-(D/E)XK nuclease superfamily